ncbi:GNAT family N-acetyltransferase [Riemerella anatipestifer]|uniref:Gcn5-related n-acetyltransferase n=3 Tax=Riemerella anatipestifer TaxID=34085 RepID=E4TA53_RIEAD|nr:GNAT family N-acetyltransferase [Riemerella anatipestifer]ADQ82213.1 GCN5-related N-acetyltransferase [Riemerella anatipestifer ATCC 11845 = DSM 15868]ADZ12284.1 Predicted acyltransferase [Riemerella anatipestifer RA-GD]AFD56213.1 gcn5-related n-acetyltransferase [Riemerella anatipestifer ATCC 11845 = DSM 15868]AFR35440.1 putative acyltransferase [Riemerella anatipestifer RA-CH-1]AGC39866.1 putative acyltransferase [Riemerella anatipestifer RA-CH-2]
MNSINYTDLTWHIKAFNELSVSELYKIMVARQEVFIIEQAVKYQDADNTDQKAFHIWAENSKGQLLAYCRIFPEGVKYNETSIGRVLTTSLGRGKGIGRQLVSYAIEAIENIYKTSRIRISAQDYLLKFYSEYGFSDTDKKYLEDNLPHTEMVRQ